MYRYRNTNAEDVHLVFIYIYIYSEYVFFGHACKLESVFCMYIATLCNFCVNIVNPMMLATAACKSGPELGRLVHQFPGVAETHQGPAG